MKGALKTLEKAVKSRKNLVMPEAQSRTICFDGVFLRKKSPLDQKQVLIMDKIAVFWAYVLKNIWKGLEASEKIVSRVVGTMNEWTSHHPRNVNGTLICKRSSWSLPLVGNFRKKTINEVKLEQFQVNGHRSDEIDQKYNKWIIQKNLDKNLF